MYDRRYSFVCVTDTWSSRRAQSVKHIQLHVRPLSVFLWLSFPPYCSVEESIALARELKARRTLLVGLGSDIEYQATNTMLKNLDEEDGAPNVRLAHDGLAVDIDL